LIPWAKVFELIFSKRVAAKLDQSFSRSRKAAALFAEKSRQHPAKKFFLLSGYFTPAGTAGGVIISSG